MKSVPNPARMPVAGSAESGDSPGPGLGQVGFAHHTFRPRPPSHHTVSDVMKPCFVAVKKHRSDTTISLRGLCAQAENV